MSLKNKDGFFGSPQFHYDPAPKRKLKAWSTAMAQPVETATDNRHTHKAKGLGVVMVNVYGFVFHACSMLNSAKPSPYYRPLRTST